MPLLRRIRDIGSNDFPKRESFIFAALRTAGEAIMVPRQHTCRSSILRSAPAVNLTRTDVGIFSK